MNQIFFWEKKTFDKSIIRICCKIYIQQIIIYVIIYMILFIILHLYIYKFYKGIWKDKKKNFEKFIK
jgi:hypothetical protein